MTGSVDMNYIVLTVVVAAMVHELGFKQGILNLQFYILCNSEIGNHATGLQNISNSSSTLLPQVTQNLCSGSNVARAHTL